MVIYAFLLGFSIHSIKKSDTNVKYKRLLNLNHHKHEPKKDTKFRKICFNGHPRYTSTNVHTHTHSFCIFFFIFYFYEKQDKTKLKKKTNKNMLSKAMHKTRLT